MQACSADYNPFTDFMTSPTLIKAIPVANSEFCIAARAMHKSPPTSVSSGSALLIKLRHWGPGGILQLVYVQMLQTRLVVMLPMTSIFITSHKLLVNCCFTLTCLLPTAKYLYSTALPESSSFDDRGQRHKITYWKYNIPRCNASLSTWIQKQ